MHAAVFFILTQPFDHCRILVDLKVPLLLFTWNDERLSVALDHIQAAVEIEMDGLVPVPFRMAEDMGDGLPVGMLELFAVGGEDESIALDDIQQFIARVVLAAVVRHFHIIDPQRVILRIAFLSQVGFHVMGIS